MPLTTTRPRTAVRISSARLKAPSRLSESADRASPAKRSTRRAAFRSASWSAWADISLALGTGIGGSPAQNRGFGLSPERKTAPHAKIMPSFADYEETNGGDQVRRPRKVTKAEILGI